LGTRDIQNKRTDTQGTKFKGNSDHKEVGREISLIQLGLATAKQATGTKIKQTRKKGKNGKSRTIAGFNKGNHPCHVTPEKAKSPKRNEPVWL